MNNQKRKTWSMENEMETFIATKLKKIRLDNNLTQKQFAKLFYMTERTIGNYENATRTPAVEFLKKVCDKFNVTLDYFNDTERKESNPANLVITTKNGKKALFDTAQSLYLSSHEYDDIFISPCGYHLAIKREQTSHQIVYSIVFDNLGRGKVFDKYILGYDGGFDKNGNIYARKDGKKCKINYHGHLVEDK